MMKSSTQQEITKAFGDFQTPAPLAAQILHCLRSKGIEAASIVEPTCGLGSLLREALWVYSDACGLGADINSEYLSTLRDTLAHEGIAGRASLHPTDFFLTDWDALLASLPEPLLVIGNPPWVTSAELTVLDSSNHPDKSNFQGRRGIEALTGKANFDVSEWMLLEVARWFDQRVGTLAMLCKTSVARKVLSHLWRHNASLDRAELRKIDAKASFSASVDAGLLVLSFTGRRGEAKCDLFDTLDAETPSLSFGYCDTVLVSDRDTYRRLRYLSGSNNDYRWRSGIKHDCARLMELTQYEQGWRNGNGEVVVLEETCLYPLWKSSDVSNGHRRDRSRMMLVTQQAVGDDTSTLRYRAPLTWRYLQAHRATFARRKSAIYRNQPDFAIFGVGDYTFAPFKVAISGFYKRLDFVVVPPHDGKPAVFDDTVYFLSCGSQEEGDYLASLLNSELARAFFISMIFWEEKRPITIELLKRLDLRLIARHLGSEARYDELVRGRGQPLYNQQASQLRLFETAQG